MNFRYTGLLGATFVLIALFLILSRFQAANALLQSGAKGYIQAVGVLQGRSVSANGTIGNIAR